MAREGEQGKLEKLGKGEKKKKKIKNTNWIKKDFSFCEILEKLGQIG